MQPTTQNIRIAVVAVFRVQWTPISEYNAVFFENSFSPLFHQVNLDLTCCELRQEVMVTAIFTSLFLGAFANLPIAPSACLQLQYCSPPSEPIIE